MSRPGTIVVLMDWLNKEIVSKYKALKKTPDTEWLGPMIDIEMTIDCVSKLSIRNISMFVSRSPFVNQKTVDEFLCVALRGWVADSLSKIEAVALMENTKIAVRSVVAY